MSPGWLSPEERDRALGYLEDRFGIPAAAFQRHRLILRGEHVCAVREDAAGAWDALQGVSAGLKLLKVSESGGLKPSSRGIQVFGRLATRNVWDVEEKELRDLLDGRSLPYHGDRGYVILRCGDAVVGVGLAREGLMVSQVPRAVTMYLRHPERGCSL